MPGKLAVVAVGGNSLITDPNHPEISHQWQAVKETCRHIAMMIATGWDVVITHGNGPQVGFNLRRSELGVEEGMHSLPLDVIVANTQGSIGYMLQQALDNALRQVGINRTVLTLVTQIRVEIDDPAFQAPSKPIGAFMSAEAARHYEQEGWTLIEDSGRGWRRVVASPRPLAIQEINAIKSLYQNGFVVIAAGGGGIPVIRNEDGNLAGVNAVIDKDLASSLLAQQLRSDLLVISTGVEYVSINYNLPDQTTLPQMTLREARQYAEAGHFGVGSMLPKVQAAAEFVRLGGPAAIITNPPNLTRAIKGETGTRIIPG